MPQTRRSIHISDTAYDVLRAHCGRTGDSMSNAVENILREFFNMPLRDTKGTFAEPPTPEPRVSEPTAAAPPSPKESADDDAPLPLSTVSF